MEDECYYLEVYSIKYNKHTLEVKSSTRFRAESGLQAMIDLMKQCTSARVAASGSRIHLPASKEVCQSELTAGKYKYM